MDCLNLVAPHGAGVCRARHRHSFVIALVLRRFRYVMQHDRRLIAPIIAHLMEREIVAALAEDNGQDRPSIEQMQADEMLALAELEAC